MIYTKNIQKAIKFAAKTHNQYQDQKRKGKAIPYITHPLAVGIILALAKASEEVIVAGILHDTIEDSAYYKRVTPEMLTERFGENVTQLVMSVTEQNKELPWEERKQTALEHIENFSHNSLLLKSADVISNMSELIDDYKRYGEQTFIRFNVPRKKTLDNQLKVIRAIISTWPENPLADDLLSLADNLIEINSVDRQVSLELDQEEFAEVKEVIEKFLEKGISEKSPKFIIYMGGIGSGKTTMRHKKCAEGYVNFDFGEICTAVEKKFGDDIQKLGSFSIFASSTILRESLASKKNIAIEIIGENIDVINPVIDKMKGIGYEVSFECIDCDPVVAYERHAKAVNEDPDYTSAYFTQEATLSYFYQELELGEMPV